MARAAEFPDTRARPFVWQRGGRGGVRHSLATSTDFFISSSFPFPPPSAQTRRPQVRGGAGPARRSAPRRGAGAAVGAGQRGAAAAPAGSGAAGRARGGGGQPPPAGARSRFSGEGEEEDEGGDETGQDKPCGTVASPEPRGGQAAER